MGNEASVIVTSLSTGVPANCIWLSKDDETQESALAFRREAAAAFPFRLTPVLTDNELNASRFLQKRRQHSY
jgi:hypothetical protein